MIALGMTVLILAVLTLCGISAAGGAVWSRRQATQPQLAPVIVTTAPQLLTELAAAHAHIEAIVQHGRIVESVEVAPASPYTLLPWQQVPSPARTFWVQGIIDTNQDLRAEVTELTHQLSESRRLHRRALNIGRTLRRRLKAMVPVESFEAVEDLRTRSLSVAKSASTRAAEMSNAISELDAARFEAITLDDFNTEFEQILVRHSLIGATP